MARYWWLVNRGPIPPGKRVIHRDGNFLNDDPANYILGTAGDVAYLARVWDPTLDARNRSAASAATREHNRERSRVRRFLDWLPKFWYAVDPEAGEALNDPRRSRVDLYRVHSDPRKRSPNGSGLVAAWLGWPEISGLEALVLAILDRPLRLPAIGTAVQDLCRRQNWPVRRYLYGTLISTLSKLRRRGFVTSIGRPRTEYSRTDAANLARHEPVPVIAVRGSDLIAGRFGALRKVDTLSRHKGDRR
ncbi:MAG: hypothetical protein PHU85_00050 [Phycisphaerae bacterium]|nr:hypothetical protein [Phycisphaerae bacterium]